MKRYSPLFPLKESSDSQVTPELKKILPNSAKNNRNEKQFNELLAYEAEQDKLMAHLRRPLTRGSSQIEIQTSNGEFYRIHVLSLGKTWEPGNSFMAVTLFKIDGPKSLNKVKVGKVYTTPAAFQKDSAGLKKLFKVL